MKTQTESHIQKEFFKWAAYMSSQRGFACLKMMFKITNEGKRSMMKNKKGQWFCIGGKRMKDEGMKSGVPDVFLPFAVKQNIEDCTISTHGLFLEFKSANGKLSDNQKWWCLHLREADYCVKDVYSLDEARESVCSYLAGNFYK